MRGRFKYEVSTNYPHLSKNEAAIWSRFVAAFPDLFDSADFDVCVGEPRPSNEVLNEATQANRQYLGKWKIDVIAWKGEIPTIIEIKKDADTKALGENWLYVKKWKEEHPDVEVVREMIITDNERPSIRECCLEANVALVVV